ncbi:ABC transporter substrate-binding protein [Lachnotalea sp. AF33-28]|uniref:ABC transporter substrate-binding protein n=1 Tax=Lachnotalea sp. AF33-28 TaxID=2292046 RepID=UPI000E54E24A|nr:ABC transporter substrate-binding protein [Lachnotalea sp. AF33-28]RHP33645.1 extracellular solute-binding protein [Lachnotalea sp. AF33-28]
MKLTRKVLALAMAFIMTLALAGCGNKSTGETTTAAEKETTTAAASTAAQAGEGGDESKEPVKLVWWYRGNGEQKDTKMVQEALNEKLKTYPGLEHVTVELKCYTASEYKQAVTLAQSSREQIDILNTVNLDFSEEVEKGSLVPLDDLIASVDGLKDILPDWLWELGSVDGQIYMVPNYQRASNMNYLVTPTEWLEKYGDAEKIEETLKMDDSHLAEKAAVLEEYVRNVQAGEGATHYMPPMGSMVYSGFGINDFTDTIYGDYIKDANGNTVFNKYVTEKMKQAFELSAKEYEEGLIHPDILTINSKDFDGANMLNDVSYVFCINNQFGDSERVSQIYSTMYGMDITAIPTKEQYYIINTWGAGGNGISSSCEHPEEAIRFINAMTSEEGKELYNLMVYGIEDVHYKKIDDNHIETLEYSGTQGGVDTSYAAMKWIIGNTFNAYLNQACTDDEVELSLQLNESDSNIKSDLIGCTFKTDAIKTELEQTTAVVTEYSKPLMYGVMGSGWESTYSDFIDKMKNAGVEKAAAELQSQVDAFLAK